VKPATTPTTTQPVHSQRSHTVRPQINELLA
jgi:hypothetical protein